MKRNSEVIILKKILNKKGETLVETITAVAMFGIIMVTVLMLYSVGQRFIGTSTKEKTDFYTATKNINENGVFDSSVPSDMTVSFDVIESGGGFLYSDTDINTAPKFYQNSKYKLIVKIAD